MAEQTAAISFEKPESLAGELGTSDSEMGFAQNDHLKNDTIHYFSWQGVSVTVQDRQAKEAKALLDGINGIVYSGEVCAIMGPSGSGKTTLLNYLARRADTGTDSKGNTSINGNSPSLASFRKISSYVEQEDALIGSLTVRETLDFASRLSNPGLAKRERIQRINDLILSFGLGRQHDTIIGTPLRKGISGGQKRRVSVASQLITAPKILFLDEPTTGLDSAASYEVMSYVKVLAKQNNLLVIASIHQPSTQTFMLFDKLLLLSAGKPHYFGPVTDVVPYYAEIGHPVPLQMNPAEYILELTNADFSHDTGAAQSALARIQGAWSSSARSRRVSAEVAATLQLRGIEPELPAASSSQTRFIAITAILVHRAFTKSYRDMIAYGVRLAMYTGLAIMCGTVWLRLGDDQTAIQPYINAIFFGSAFMSFMAVAYVPSFLEDRQTFVKERQNGLYGAAAFTLANFLIGLPFLFAIAAVFSLISYWLIGLRSTAPAFFTWLMWVFLDMVAAESLVVLVASLVPNFVVALSLTAFANGLWMCVGGFMVPRSILNVFWKYVFSYINYQTYVFQGMMVNEFRHRDYACDADCHCMYQTELADQCRISGVGVLQSFDYSTHLTGTWVGILIGIIAGYRLLGWAALAIRRR